MQHDENAVLKGTHRLMRVAYRSILALKAVNKQRIAANQLIRT